jgi:hypothetical protein
MNWHFDRFVSVSVTLVILAVRQKVTWDTVLSTSLGWLIGIAMIAFVTWVWHSPGWLGNPPDQRN